MKQAACSELTYHQDAEVAGDLWRSFSPTPCSNRVSWNRLISILSSQHLNVTVDGDSITCLFQCLTILTINIFFSCLNGISCVPACAHCLLSQNKSKFKKTLCSPQNSSEFFPRIHFVIYEISNLLCSL